MQAERRTVTYTRHEWVLPSGCHWTEVAKAMDSANKARDGTAGERIRSDVYVDAIDDEIVICWKEDRTDG